MKLAEHLSLRTPLLWVTTDEPGRVIDIVIDKSERQVFRLDDLYGLITWNSDRKKWLKVLVPDEEGNEGPTNDPGAAMQYVLEHRGIMLIENAHNSAEMLAGFFLSLVFDFRQAFYSDDLDKIPAQFVLMSYKDEIPGEIARMITHLHHELPDEEEIFAIVNHLDKQLEMHSDFESIARAGVGLSETEFISTALLSVKERGGVDGPFVNKAKLELLKNNGILEVRTPDLTINDLGGMDNAKELIDQISWTWTSPHEARELHIEPIRRVMLVGVPGTGKSLFCEAISSQLELDLAKGGISNAMNKFVGESEANMRRMFATLKRMAPIVFWIDEFGRDMSGGMSSGSVDGGTTDRVHGEFLTGIQELPENIFLAAAANRIEDLPPEMTRADRFDRIMFVGFPTQSEREEIFRIHLGKGYHEYNLVDLAAHTRFFTGAEIKALIKEVRFQIGTKERRKPKNQEIINYIPHVKGRVWINHRDPIVSMYQRARVEWDWASSEQQAEAEEVLAVASGKHVSAPHPQQAVPKYKPTFNAPKKWGM